MKHLIVKGILVCGLFLALLWLVFASVTERRNPIALNIRYDGDIGMMEINGSRMTRVETVAFLEKIYLPNLQRVVLVGFEHGAANQIRRTYDLLSERGYGGNLTLVFSQLEIPVWIYPIEDHHHEFSLNQTQVLDILVESEGLRIGKTRIHEFVDYQTNETNRIIYGGIRDRVFDSVIYEDSDMLMEAVRLQNLPKDIPIEVVCAESGSGLPVLQVLRGLSLLGFEKFYLVFY